MKQRFEFEKKKKKTYVKWKTGNIVDEPETTRMSDDGQTALAPSVFSDSPTRVDSVIFFWYDMCG